MGARLIDRGIGSAGILLNQFIGEHVSFDFFSADVGEHFAVDLNAWAEHLAALFDHFLALVGVVNDVAIFERKVVFTHHGANALAPATSGFQIGNNLRFLHRKNAELSCHRLGGAQVFWRLRGGNLPINDIDDPRSPGSDGRVMSRHDQGGLAFGAQRGEKLDDFVTGVRIQIAGGLVGEH